MKTIYAKTVENVSAFLVSTEKADMEEIVQEDVTVVKMNQLMNVHVLNMQIGKIMYRAL